MATAIHTQESGWMSDDLVVDWFKFVLRKPSWQYTHKEDGFRGRLTDKVKAGLHEVRTYLAVILGGPTGMLQPLDIGVNRPFKVELRRRYTKQMASSNHEKTPTGRLKQAPLASVAEQILCASLSPIFLHIVAKSFKVTGISNNLYGTEGNLVPPISPNPASMNLLVTTIKAKLNRILTSTFGCSTFIVQCTFSFLIHVWAAAKKFTLS